MYEIIRQALERGGYTREKARKRILFLVAQGELTEEQAEELLAVAGERADVPGETELAVAELRQTVAGVVKALQALVDAAVPAAKKPLVQAALDALTGQVGEEVAL